MNLVRFGHNWNEMLEHEGFGRLHELSGRRGLIRGGAKYDFNVMGLDHAELDVSGANAVDKAIHRA